MASKQIGDLKNDIYRKTIEFQHRCREQDIDLLVYCTNRSLEEQAILYRKSRTTSEIQKKINKFREHGLGFLSDIIEGVGKQFGTLGQHFTYAAPAESWHQFGEAFDCVPMENGKCLWNDSIPEVEEKWESVGKIGVELGFSWGGNWKNFLEKPHFQLKLEGNPLKLFNPQTIKKMLDVG